MVGNDEIQDLIHKVQALYSGELSIFLSNMSLEALKESRTEWEQLQLSDPDDEKSIFESNKRRLFLGIVFCLISKPDSESVDVSSTQIETAISLVKELCHVRHLSRWKDPDDRSAELFLANKGFLNYKSKYL